MSLIVSGTLAFDTLADYPGAFGDSVLPDRLDSLNVCFVIGKLIRRRGGTAGNMAHNLVLLGERPEILASIGDDSDGREYLRIVGEVWGLPTGHVKVVPGLSTPNCYIATDIKGNQLIFFNPGAMETPSDFKAEKPPEGTNPGERLAIVAPTGTEDMKNLSRAFRENGIPFIYDPGQQVNIFDGEEHLRMLEGADLFIVNEYEYEFFLKRTGKKPEELFDLVPAAVVTDGAAGSRLLTRSGSERIKPVPVKKVANPTGAGDAYRAGMMKALSKGLDLLSACRLGSACASFCVEAQGTQEHVFDLPAVLGKVRETYGVSLDLN
ncbi:MAG: carbohydrate kinase family protein [Deltaproteobacteria bacterium]|jgi:adenosine kinase|nr:carbohydrate kinase family protein [Deltaproteobacteria bacterium]